MFTIENVTNLVWDNSEKTSFHCDVKYAEFNEIHPTGVDNVDQYAHIKELWEKGNAGVYGQIANYVEPPVLEIVAAEEQPQTQGSQNL